MRPNFGDIISNSYHTKIIIIKEMMWLRYWQVNGVVIQVAGSKPGWAPLPRGLGQATYTCMPLSPSSIIWGRPRGVIFFSLAGKVTTGLVESNGSLPSVYDLVKCRPTVKKPGSASSPVLVIEYGTIIFSYENIVFPHFWVIACCNLDL